MPKMSTPTDDPLQIEMAQTMARHAMVDPGDQVLVGVSGGPDSVTLAHALSVLASQLDFTVVIAHLDHNQRPEAAPAEAALVQTLAERLKVAFHTGKIEARLEKGSLEEQLRAHRYAFFKQKASALGCNRIAVGHHAEDNAEAVLINLLRGSGLQGLSGIPPVREGLIIRPLIHSRRAQIMAYIERHGLPYINDPSNEQWRFRRNRIRHHLMPLLTAEYNPNIVDTLNRMAMICLEEEAQREQALQPLLTALIRESAPKELWLDVSELNKVHRAVQRRLLRMALGRWLGHLRRFGVDHIEAIIDLSAGDRQGKLLHLPRGVLARRTATQLEFTRVGNLRRTAPLQTAGYRYTITASENLPHTLDIIEAGCKLHFAAGTPPESLELKSPRKDAIILDMDALEFPLTVRNQLPGDRIRPFGLQGSQTIKQLYINHKLPKSLRPRHPLLLSGNAIVWAVGIRRGETAAVTANTKRVLRVSMTPSTTG